MSSRVENITSLSDSLFDLVVIGGGITGAGIALTAAKKGWKVLIIDKGDFASGTSSKSAKMIHGGLRYLENFEFKLVEEALHEREHLLRDYPHLVRPQPFFVPVYHSKLSQVKLGIGLSMYDKLSGRSSLPDHTKINKSEIRSRFPQIESKDIVGGYIYYDAQTNDARLTNEVIQQATEYGATALNYFELKEISHSGQKVSDIICEDKLTGETHRVFSKVFISAAGVWTDEIMQKINPTDQKKYNLPSKGVHIVVNSKHLPQDVVLLLPTVQKDKRMIWCMPWENNLNVIGTTDTDYFENVDNIEVQKNEVHYLLDSVNARLKGNKLTENDIICVYAGLRPLLNDKDFSKKSNQRSRDYRIWWNNKNMLTIAGGKLTSFLSMSEQAIKAIETKFRFDVSNRGNIEMNQVSSELTARFEDQYGKSNALLITQIAEEDDTFLRLFEGYNCTPAEIIFYIRYQHAVRLDDILTRRTTITYLMKEYDEKIVEEVARLLGKELNLNNLQIEKEINIYKAECNKMHYWK